MSDGLSSEFWWAGIAVGQWLIRLGALVVVPRRRSPDAAKGWLLLFFVLPILALVIYLFIGRARFPKWRRDRVSELPEVISRAVGSARSTLEQSVRTLPATSGHIAELAQAIGGLPPVGGSTLDLEPDYSRVLERLAEDIDGATNHVHLMYYIFANDAAGDQILSALERASARGVTCRLLIDAFGSGSSRRALARRLSATRVEMHLILPIRFWNRATRADMRNHRKLAVIDGCIGWAGSQNIVNAAGEADKSNRELMVRATGTIVSELQIVFLGDWYLETRQELQNKSLFPPSDRPEEGAIAQVVPSGPDYPLTQIDMLFTAAVGAARDHVVLTSPYFIPSEPLVFAMRSAALRGVEVQLILSAQTDSRLVDFAQKSYFIELLEAGVEIYLDEANFLHAKHISVDDAIAMIGSSNIDMRSFELNSELTLVTYDEGVVRRLHTIEADYRSKSRRVDVEMWRQRGRFKATLQNIARLFSPLL